MSEIYTVTLPDIGEGVVEGEVIEWLKEIDEEIAQDEAVVVVMTDKATVELPAPYPGKLAKRYYEAGGTAIKDEPLYDIALSAEAAAKIAPNKKKQIKEKTLASANSSFENSSELSLPKEDFKAKESQEFIFKREKIGSCQRALACPAVRKLAKDLRIHINDVPGTGPDGRVTQADLLKFSSSPASSSAVTNVKVPELPGDDIRPIKGVRLKVSEKMSLSKSQIPHFSLFDQANAKFLIQLRENIKPQAEQRGIKLTFMPFFLKALSKALQDFENFNASFDHVQKQLHVHKEHNIAIAMKSNDGLLVPVLKKVNEMSLEEVIFSFDQIKQKAADKSFGPEDMSNSTISLSNFGSEGNGLWVTPVINYPQVAILASGRIRKELVVKDDQAVIAPILPLCWSFDHRIIDGDVGIAFSKRFVGLIENPQELL